jgi:tetratricopeptide (TPR) repeat protein
VVALALTCCVLVTGQQTTDLGKVDFPTSASPGAQVHFLRGLAWLYNFGYDEARGEFQQAQMIEPGFALSYWGEAMSHYQPVWHQQDDEGGRRALARLGETPASRAAKAGTPRERAYLGAVEILFGVGDQPIRQLGFARAMAELSQTYPGDLEAACLYALAVLATTPLEGPDPRREIAGSVAEGVFAKNPRHPGAAHAIIHAFDDREYSARALPAARTYAQIAPASSHARHMPAHIFIELGMWDEAAASDEAAFAVSDAAVRRRGASLADRDYHPLTWLVYERLQQGQYRSARAAMKPFEEAIAAGSDARIENDLATLRAYYVIETRRWAEMRTQDRFGNADELFAVGLSAAKLGDLARAEQVLTALLQTSARDSDPTRKEIATLMGHELQATVHLARGRGADAIASMERAVAIEDRYPPAVGRQRPVKSSHELFGEMLLDLRRPNEARTHFEQALRRAANRALSVLGLARAYAAVGNRLEARRQYEKVLANWRQADPDVPGLQEAKDFLR